MKGSNRGQVIAPPDSKALCIYGLSLDFLTNHFIGVLTMLSLGQHNELCFVCIQEFALQNGLFQLIGIHPHGGVNLDLPLKIA